MSAPVAVEDALCWTELMAAWVETGELQIAPADPMSDLLRINSLRRWFELTGVVVPAMPDPTYDPIGNLLAWRDFRRSQTTVH